jgi:hypothetical protein
VTGEEWAGIGAVVTAVAGSIALVIKTWRSPDADDAKALPGQKHVTQADLDAIRTELTALVHAAEEAWEDQATELRTARDKDMREVLERVHGLALKVERLLAAHEERHEHRSQRGGRR